MIGIFYIVMRNDYYLCIIMCNDESSIILYFHSSSAIYEVFIYLQMQSSSGDIS